jgi:phenylacetate-CoA ligase
LLAILFQLEQSQWLSPAELAARQSAQLAQLVGHAYRTVPYYRRCFDQLHLDPNTIAERDSWSKLPVLTRTDVQEAGDELVSTNVPKEHGQISTLMTSGSSGTPVVVRGTGLTRAIWQALTLREHIWHRRDFALSFAGIRYVRAGTARYPAGETLTDWGSATHGIVETGPAYLLNIESSIEEQAEWLTRVNPHYLLTYPSVLTGLAESFRDKPGALANLREVRTFGEIVDPSLRALAPMAWNVKLTDMYSSQENGYIALQCPETENYHVQNESILVEVINEQGRACQSGEVGRIVVTSLHNFAMPLLRYDIGDYAEVGDSCSCGRGLTVLRRILGRKRNLLTLPNGERRWPLFGEGEGLDRLPPIRQFQVVQHSVDRVEVKVVVNGPLSDSDQQAIKHYVQVTLGHPFQIDVNQVPAITRHPTGKFEDFISLVDGGGK